MQDQSHTSQPVQLGDYLEGDHLRSAWSLKCDPCC